MGKNNTIIKHWLSDEGRMASLINECLFSGKQIFKKEHLKLEDGVQGVVLRTGDGKETVIERYRDLVMTADDGTRIVILACENQDEIHYGMTVRGMYMMLFLIRNNFDNCRKYIGRKKIFEIPQSFCRE